MDDYKEEKISEIDQKILDDIRQAVIGVDPIDHDESHRHSHHSSHHSSSHHHSTRKHGSNHKSSRHSKSHSQDSHHGSKDKLPWKKWSKSVRNLMSFLFCFVVLICLVLFASKILEDTILPTDEDSTVSVNSAQEQEELLRAQAQKILDSWALPEI